MGLSRNPDNHNNDSIKKTDLFRVLDSSATDKWATVNRTPANSATIKSATDTQKNNLTIADLLIQSTGQLGDGQLITCQLGDGQVYDQVGWRITVQWLAGNFACKAFLFLRAFGLYLSSNVLICVSLDRYFAVLHPLKVNDARRRGKIMLAFAWSMSLIYSIPQSVVFHLSPHPNYPAFFQCVTFGFFVSRNHEIAYNLFCVLAMYFIPLMVIVGAYSAIMWEISSKSKESA
ncbi:PREDICTED: gonadotropin-releasing hormone II receptor-like, partial [Nicrophorus vespilloides]|uniref:Gonadotropin-releasing hormone II receptor-like n=1 Tax=Nicrophorus vespilloides TaxID=110193 RepID=A0ABM1NJ54_NICVS